MPTVAETVICALTPGAGTKIADFQDVEITY